MKLDHLLIGVGVLFLLARAHQANSNPVQGQNPYAYNSNESEVGFPGAMDLNSWNSLNGTPNYYLGSVGAQSSLSNYFASNNRALVSANSGAPVGMF